MWKVEHILSILLLIKKNWIQNTGWDEFVFIKETKKQKTKKKQRGSGVQDVGGRIRRRAKQEPKTLKTKLAVSECGLSGVHTERIEEEKNKKSSSKKKHTKSQDLRQLLPQTLK